MKKISPLFLLSALFLSCASSGISYSKTPEPTESPVSTPSSSNSESSSSSEPSVSEETKEVYYHSSIKLISGLMA